MGVGFLLEMKWSLNELYKSFDSKKFKDDMVKCDSLIKDLNDSIIEITKDTKEAVKKLEWYIQFSTELQNVVLKLMSYCNLTLSVDTKNQTALKYIEILENKLTDIVVPEARFKKWISTLNSIDFVIEGSSLLRTHKFFIKELIESGKYILSENEEMVIAKMKNTGSNAWKKLQDLVASTLLVDINIDKVDKRLPLTVIRNMAYDKDEKKRKRAYDAEIKSYGKIEALSASCINGIKGEVISLCDVRGYKSPLENTLINSRMDSQTLDAMFSAIDEKLPSLRRYYKKKAEILGCKNGLPFYSLFAPVGEVNMTYTYEEAKDFIVRNFRSFSDKLADFAENAFSKQWIDAEMKEGKVGGAFCQNIHAIGESRVMSNFGGYFNDVVTLAHELGHAYHGFCLKDESILNSDYPMPIAETASTFCETIVKNAAMKSTEKSEAFTILESSLADSTQVIIDIYSRFLFETELFKRRKISSVSSDELKAIMISSQKESYGDGLDPNYLHPYMWVCKPHYYDAEYNYYNFPYAFGLLFSKGLYAQYIAEGESFVKKYDDLLAAAGKNNLVDMAKIVGIDIHSKGFWIKSLEIIEEEIEKFISM